MAKRYNINPVKPFDLTERGFRTVSSDPASSFDGDFILNTTDNKIKVWFASQWQVLHTLSGLADALLLENGDFALLENGDKILLEG